MSEKEQEGSELHEQRGEWQEMRDHKKPSRSQSGGLSCSLSVMGSQRSSPGHKKDTASHSASHVSDSKFPSRPIKKSKRNTCNQF